MKYLLIFLFLLSCTYDSDISNKADSTEIVQYYNTYGIIIKETEGLYLCKTYSRTSGQLLLESIFEKDEVITFNEPTDHFLSWTNNSPMILETVKVEVFDKNIGYNIYYYYEVNPGVTIRFKLDIVKDKKTKRRAWYKVKK
jgi:hypothetical protein